jgi:hypothetical protein
VSVHGPLWLYFEPLLLLNFQFYLDTHPAFHPYADPDPTSKNNAKIMRIHANLDPIRTEPHYFCTVRTGYRTICTVERNMILEAEA